MPGSAIGSATTSCICMPYAPCMLYGPQAGRSEEPYTNAPYLCGLEILGEE